VLIDLRGLEIPIVVTQCGEANAYYAAASRDITVCYELLSYANELSGKSGAALYQLDRDAAATLIFATLHEIGHALVDALGLPLHTDDEDMADQLAFLVLTNTDHAEQVAHDAGDVHRPSSERAFVAVCMLYGRHRDPALGEALGAEAERCLESTARIVDAWNEALAPYTRLDTGRTFFDPL
jgi:hypothetical protein